MSQDERYFAVFDTPVGRCGMAWSAYGITLLQLPEGRESATRARLGERQPGAVEAAPPAAVQRAMAAVVKLLEGGGGAELSAIDLDFRGVPPFHGRVYDAARLIPPGATLSYGELAAELDAPGAARAVGQALRRNPFAIIVPCHRVLAAGGKLGGFTANGGLATKRRLLALESRVSSAAEAGLANEGALRFDPEEALRHLRQSDARLARLIDAVGPFRIELQRTASVFAALAEAIVYQQLHGKAAASIFARLCGLFENAQAGLTPQQILRASDDKLRSAGLSRAKMLALQDLARRTKAGTLPSLEQIQQLDDEAVIERLVEVRGIGRWTAEMLLIFRLGRADVLPVDDYGVRKGFALTFKKKELPRPADLRRHAERWRPFRSVASWYLWRALDA